MWVSVYWALSVDVVGGLVGEANGGDGGCEGGFGAGLFGAEEAIHCGPAML